MKEDNKSLCEYDQGHLDGIEVGYEIAMQKINKIRAEIKQIADEEQKYDEKWAIGLRYAVKIIDKYIDESEDTSYDLSDGIIAEKEKQV